LDELRPLFEALMAEGIVKHGEEEDSARAPASSRRYSAFGVPGATFRVCR